MKVQLAMAKLPKDNVKVMMIGDYLMVAYDFVKVEQPASSSEDATEQTQTKDDSYIGDYIELRGGVRSYDAIVSAIIEDKYPSDKMDAIRLNFELAQNSVVTTISLSDEKCDEYLAEYKAMQEWRVHAKEIARKAADLINSAQ